MGVHDLWRLLAPCGHRLSLSVLNRRRLAVDVSIWLAQFVKALPTSQPHLLGLLRRLCKLHYHHILAVCVFDGPAPALKKRTLEQRRRQRERQRESFERVAERLVLEQLKMKSVRDLRRELAKRKKKAEEAAAAAADSKQERKEREEDQLEDDAAASTLGSRQSRPVADDSELMQVIDDAEDDPELVLLRQLQEEEDGNSAQDIVARWEQQGSSASEPPARSSSSSSSSPPSRARTGRSLTSLTAEEKKLGLSATLSSESEEEAASPLPVIDPLSYQLPASGELDSSVLASLPISLQYSLLEQHRSHHHSLSMRRYAAVAGDMSRFSALQMGSFLRQVEFNQEIERKRVEMNRREEMQGMQVRQLPGDRGRQFVYMRREDSRQQQEAAKRREEQEEETQRRLERWKEREQEGVKYIDAHLSRIKAEEQRHWRCDDCGAHNVEDDSGIADMCQQCGAMRKQRQDSGGTIGILLGERQSAQLHQAQQPVRDPPRAARKETKRVASFLSSPSSSSSAAGRPTAASSTVYWQCPNCSFLNSLHLPRCEICRTEKPDDVQPELISLSGAGASRQLSSSGSGKAEAIHIMEDDDEQAVAATQDSPARTAAAASSVSAPIEISFDLNGAMDEDSFPPDFFAAFEEPTAAAAAPPPSTPAPAAISPAASVPAKALSSATGAASLLLPPMTLREAEKIRRPRMRLKKLDVKEIIWFDDDEPDKPPRPHAFAASSLSAPPARPLPSAVSRPVQAALRIAEQPEVDDDVEEIVVRGRAKLVKKRSEDAKETEAKAEERGAVSLNSDFLEDDEAEDDFAQQLEGKYDDDDDGGGGGTEEEVREEDDEDRELKQAIALSLAAAAAAAGQAVQAVDEDMDDVQEERRVVAAGLDGRPAVAECSVLETIVEDEEEVEEEPERSVTASATRAATRSVDAQHQPTASPASAAVLVDIGQQEKQQLPEPLSAPSATPAVAVREEEVAAAVSSSASVCHSSAADARTAAFSAEETAAVRSASVATAEAVSVSDAARGLLLPSLSSLSAPPPKPTNVFFLEKEQTMRAAAAAAEQAAQQQEKAAAPTGPSAASPPASAASAGSSSPSGSSASSRPIAVWSSAGDDVGSSSGGSFDAHLSSVLTESEQTTTSLSRMKTKQARQQQQVTAEMVDDCRHLLSLFGCPYIISPAEAEAQCATLELLGLVDGVVTEDSDVFLFGARHVYRNIFEQKKYAERYRVDEVEAVLGLDRNGLISLALLLGSDYTGGVHGIGIVNAMEIVNAFPGQGNDGLREFRHWVYSGSVEKRPTLPELRERQQGETAEQAAERERLNAALVQAYRKQLFKYKHRNIRTSWHVERDFPSDEVRRGYEQPTVDASTEPLSWSRPRWDAIIAFLRDKFREEEEDRKRDGNSAETEAEWVAMVQTLRTSWEEEEERYRRDPSYQQQIDAFFTADDRFAAVRSRRINAAIRGLTRKKEHSEPDQHQPAHKRKTTKKKKETEREAKAGEAEAEEKQAEASPAALSSRPGTGRGRGRAAGRAGVAAVSLPARSVAVRMREARERRSREDAEWLDDDVVLVDDDDAGGDGDDGDWRTESRRGGRGGGQRRDPKRGRLTGSTALY